MRRHLALAAAAALTAAAPAQADFELGIIHINDLHSRMEPISKYDGPCKAEDDAAGKCFGGIARVAAKIAELRARHAAEGRPALVLDAGDQFQGSLFYTTYKGAAAAEFMNLIGFDAMAVGNHEFDDGPEGLAGFLDKVRFPVISGNLDVSANNRLAGRVAPYVILDAGGRKVGVVSALATDTAETSSPGPTVKFADEAESLRAAVAELEGQGVNVIIALTHVGLPADIRLAQGVPGIDAVVGGHSHTWLSASDRKAAGPYPVWVSGPGDALVPVVQAYAYSKFVGDLTLRFDDEGALLDAWGDTVLLDASVTPDAAVAARVKELAGPIEEVKRKVVSEAAAPIDGSRESCRSGECEMGNLVADAMLERTRGQGVTIAIQNGGGLRASIDQGEITMGEVLTVLPFQNTLATFRLKGADVIAALENGVSQVEELAGRFPQVAGLRFVWLPDKPAGSRIEEVLVRKGDGWAPIDAEAEYMVVSNNYMRAGGDGYKVFAEKAMDAYDYGPGLEVAVADYLAARAPYKPYLDGRISRR
ncbi:bifunctional metallophosphatase/5'-nucleotidase [Oceanicella actignis]|uniref:5'-nucleotidase n=1 Tax=Oceanicella actignis TaxID=1189325 RepID=A0A1M7TSJ9_9RHOB|nr:bifunctional metallophosphatase/5'-nucleotidase [Oceanicella actignis]SET76419.1 5'-nucleotidase [Oceanicella actignis]SHN73734.1 5'-nucleotidase [Oceanicella actignis]